MKVVSYLSSIPQSKPANPDKLAILHKFIQGVNAAGDTGLTYQGNEVQFADVGLIQGWQHEAGKNAAHLKLRSDVSTQQLARNKYCCVADANLFLFSSLTGNSPHYYLRYSFNGVFPDTGVYFDDSPVAARWDQIQKDLDITIGDNKIGGRHILLCTQRNGGWSMGPYSIHDWLISTIAEIRKYTDRPIVIRAHPGDKRSELYIKHFRADSSLIISNNTMDGDLHNCHAVVNHNSSSIVGSLIAGYPAFITDSLRSQCAEVASADLSQIETPQTYDRIKWLHRISMCHWKFSELENGDAWRHMRNYVQ